jgi:Neutral/alkaline non-lysosomal ceramidase, N-terminal
VIFRAIVGWLITIAAAGAALGTDSPLQVGFGEADVTPTVVGQKPVYLAGFGQNRQARGVHDPIMARSIVLADGKKKVAFVAVDVVGLFRDVAESVRKQLTGFDYVLVSSTHNHEGPDTLGLWGQNPFKSGVDPDYLKQVEAGIVKAVKDADAARQEAAAHIGTANAPELLHDGREPYVKHDELVAIRFSDPDGHKPIGVLVQWNCHPETLDSKNNQVSADFVASTVSALRKSQQCPVVYLTGTVGGLMTSLKVEIKGASGELLKDGTFEKTEAYGRRVAALADRALETAKPITLVPLEARTREILLPIDNKVYQLGWQLGVLKRNAYLWNGDAFTATRTEAPDLKKPTALATEVGYLKLGDLEVAAIPGEIYPELVLGKVQDPPDPGADFPDAPIEPSIYGQFTAKHRMLIGLANDEIGYIIPKRQWDEKPPFCYGRQRAQYGEVNSVGPETAPIVCEAFKRLVGKKD